MHTLKSKLIKLSQLAHAAYQVSPSNLHPHSSWSWGPYLNESSLPSFLGVKPHASLLLYLHSISPRKSAPTWSSDQYYIHLLPRVRTLFFLQLLLHPLLAFPAKTSSPYSILAVYRQDDVHLRFGCGRGSPKNRSSNCRHR